MYSRSTGEVNSDRVTSSLHRKRTRLPTHAHEVRALTFEVTDTLEVMTYYLVVHKGPGETRLVHTTGRASPPNTVRQRTLPLSYLYPSDNCELPVTSLRTALQVQDRSAEPLLFPQIEAQTISPRPTGHHDDDDYQTRFL